MTGVVVKSNHVVEASYRLTLNEQRLVLLCIRQIKKGQKIDAATPFSISASEFADMFSVSLDRAYSELQTVADRLYERSVTVHQPDPEEPKLAATKTRWITAIDYIPSDGRVRLYFSSKMVPYISMLEGNFTRYNLENIAKMNSIYGIRFYELMKSWLFGDSRKVKQVEINELKELLDLKDDNGKYQYPSIKDFKLYVLDKAMSDINKHSDIYAGYETSKTGRKITHFSFTFGLKVKEKQAAESKAKAKQDTSTKRKQPLKTNTEEAQQVLNDFLGMQNLAKTASKELAELATPQQMEKYRKYRLI